jgi:beta-N-acetylhexosaminidase
VRRTSRIALAVAIVMAGCGGPARPTSSTPPTGTPSASPSATPSVTLEPTGTPAASAGPSLAQLVGQKLVVRMEGTTPSAALLGRIGRGEVGGVILFGFNITTPAALTALTGKLQAAAQAGGQPPLLIAVDQEGGAASRISWAPPTLSAPQMGNSGSAAVARAQGASTGVALAGLGINVDLAPVADVPASSASFMERDGRAFSSDAAQTALLAAAFASGLASAGVEPTMKHFPGIGYATQNTDSSIVLIRATQAALAPGLLPYRAAIGHAIPLVMLSNATYTAYDPGNAAGWSFAISTTLLRQGLGFTGVSITDSMDGTAFTRGVADRVLAVRAATAGTDLILLTGSEGVTAGVYSTLLAEAMDGSIPTPTLRASYDRILALKAHL